MGILVSMYSRLGLYAGDGIFKAGESVTALRVAQSYGENPLFILVSMSLQAQQHAAQTHTREAVTPLLAHT